MLEYISEHRHPVEFVSSKLNNAEVNYSATDREFVTIVHCLVSGVISFWVASS